jgi:murein DD-endopeptidase MepM/ murein hydrolase activator NlpD
MATGIGIEATKGLAWGAALAAALILAGCNQSGRPLPEKLETAAPAVAPGTMDAQRNYVVIEGDTVYGIANRFKVPIRSLIDENALKAPYALRRGERLHIPEQSVYVAKAGDSVYSIATQFHVDQSQFIRFNELQPPYTIKPGQKLLLPAPMQTMAATPAVIPAPRSAVVAVPLDAPAPANAANPAVAPSQPTPLTPPQPAPMPAASPSVKPLGAPATPTTNAATASAPSTSAPAGAAPSPAATPSTTASTASPVPATKPVTAAPSSPAQPDSVAAIPQPASRAGGLFMWPVNGKIISNFGPTASGLHNDGINIAAPRGTPVHAAENGVVVYAGNQLRGFGNLLLIRHADGWVTAYAHNDTLLVKKGEQVKRGQVIARVGSTGNVSSPQLHFELRKGTEAVDPKIMLGGFGA